MKLAITNVFSPHWFSGSASKHKYSKTPERFEGKIVLQFSEVTIACFQDGDFLFRQTIANRTGNRTADLFFLLLWYFLSLRIVDRQDNPAGFAKYYYFDMALERHNIVLHWHFGLVYRAHI